MPTSCCSYIKNAFDQNNLGHHLPSVDLCIERIAPNEESRLLLTKTVAKFDEDDWKKRLERGTSRQWWVHGTAFVALAEEDVSKAKEEKERIRKRRRRRKRKMQLDK